MASDDVRLQVQIMSSSIASMDKSVPELDQQLFSKRDTCLESFKQPPSRRYMVRQPAMADVQPDHRPSDIKIPLRVVAMRSSPSQGLQVFETSADVAVRIFMIRASTCQGAFQ